MKNYTKEEINSLITRFEARELPKVEWTHEAHLAVAIWYSVNYDADTALDLVRENITKHNESVGTPNTDSEGYHESITVFWLMVAGEFLKSQTSDSIEILVNNFINSDFSGSHYPLDFYSTNRLFSVEARRNWVEPDLRVVDWLSS